MLATQHIPPVPGGHGVRSKTSQRWLRKWGALVSGLAVLLMLHRYALKLSVIAAHRDALINTSTDHTKFHPGADWLDVDGSPIQAHAGGILEHNGVHFWFGEDKGGVTFVPLTSEEDARRYTTQRVDVIGVRCYSSTNLLDWKDEGLVLQAGQHPDLDPSRVLERPKVIYNQSTRRFVMWMHIDDVHYEEARAGVAWADKPTGPFHYLGSLRPHGEMSRDLTLFKDDDERAYLVYASEDNKVLHVAELAQDYLSVLPHYTRVLPGLSREAPALFKHQGRYFLLTSGCTGWAPNPAEVFMAPSLEGPWLSLGNPCRDAYPGACDTFFGAQGSYVLPVPGREGQGHFIVLADRWDVEKLGSSRYVWLPVWLEIQPRSRQLDNSSISVVVRWFDQWDRGVFDEPQGSYQELVQL